MNLKTKITGFLLVLTLALLLVACGENTGAGNPASNSPSNTPATTAASQPDPPQGNTGTGSSGNPGKVDPCQLFSQSDAETALGVRLTKNPSKDNSAFYTCFYSTYDDGSLTIKDSSLLSVMVYANEATPAWYTSVKRGYQEQNADSVITPVEGLGNDAFAFVATDHFTDGKTVNLGVLQNKTFFIVTVTNTHLEEGAQAANLKKLARKIAASLN